MKEKKMIYKVGFARCGGLQTFWNHMSFPAGINGEDLRLSEMVPADDVRCIVYKPLSEDWYLLAGIHKGITDRNAPIVAARLFNRPAAEELFSKPEKLLRLGLFLRDIETAISVECYQSAEPEYAFSMARFPMPGDEWKCEAARPETVELLVYGYLNTISHNFLHFIDASPADLLAALMRVPVALSVDCGFSLPFNMQSGCCTDMNLCPQGDAMMMLYEMGAGWPCRTRVELSRKSLSDYAELRLPAEAILSMQDNTKWQKVFGMQSAPQTWLLLYAMGAVLEAEKAKRPRSYGTDLLVKTLQIEKQKATECVKALDRLIGPEQSHTSKIPRSRKNAESPAQITTCPYAQERTEFLQELKRAERIGDQIWLLVFLLAVVGLALLLLTTLVTGERELTLQLTLNTRSVAVLLLTLVIGMYLGRNLR